MLRYQAIISNALVEHGVKLHPKDATNRIIPQNSIRECSEMTETRKTVNHNNLL